MPPTPSPYSGVPVSRDHWSGRARMLGCCCCSMSRCGTSTQKKESGGRGVSWRLWRLPFRSLRLCRLSFACFARRRLRGLLCCGVVVSLGLGSWSGSGVKRERGMGRNVLLVMTTRIPSRKMDITPSFCLNGMRIRRTWEIGRQMTGMFC